MNLLLLAWSEGNLRKCLELLLRTAPAGLFIVNIELNNLFTGHLPGILNGKGYIHISALLNSLQIGISEGRIRQAMSERELRRQLLAVIVTVTDIESFAIVELAVLAANPHMGRVVGQLDREGLRQLTGRIDASEQNIGNRFPAALACQPGMKHAWHILNPGIHR
ncbi:hypothetical protein D3C77_517330 [compost metagenome]